MALVWESVRPLIDVNLCPLFKFDRVFGVEVYCRMRRAPSLTQKCGGGGERLASVSWGHFRWYAGLVPMCTGDLMSGCEMTPSSVPRYV